MMIKLDYSMFFDRAKVQRAISRAKRGVLSKAGSFVRRRAQTSIRRRKGTSAPGKPPHSHTGTLRKLIFFGYDPAAESVVIGPTQFRAEDGKTDGAERLEFGGTVRRKGQRRRYRRRPFMGPALEAESDNFPGLFKDSVKG